MSNETNGDGQTVDTRCFKCQMPKPRGCAMTKEQKAWRVIMFTLLAIQIGLLIAMLVTDWTYNLMLLVPIVMIAALLVTMAQSDKPASKGGG